ncbi:hypothetical protein LAZ67_23000451 [Cordylochernes scorpioides]|uniref:Uncharacterized protein n=1 Tax=Cordylochernes scorpioides TaxID=51811 RepID=A0ABY6LQE4_9ARAC|nr:hypothetical protein LAZ67_23000451 [Cordylochernes scorpioides]
MAPARDGLAISVAVQTSCIEDETELSAHGIPNGSDPAAPSKEACLIPVIQSLPFTIPTCTNDVLNIDDFERIVTIGKGGFGSVFLAQHKNSRDFYALKAMKKRPDFKTEREVLQIAKGFPFLMGLVTSFETPDEDILVMDLVEGFNFLHYMNQWKKISEEKARFYTTETALALHYLHTRNIIHRDVKLENILLNSDGHIKLVDYGLCKLNIKPGQKTSRFCGTLTYMAPEIIQKKPYDFGVDWWALGATLYEMLLIFMNDVTDETVERFGQETIYLKIYTGNLEDKIIDIGLELKNIKMKNNESINEYMARAKNIASQSSSLGHQISQRELAFHIVRGIHPRLEKIAVVLRIRRDLTLDEIRQSLREEENRMNFKMNGSHSDENEQAYRSKDRRNHYLQNRQKECFVCHKKGHLAKDCWFKNKRTQEQHGRRNANSNTNYNKQNFRNIANTVSSKPAEQTFNTSTDRVFENSSNNYSQIQTWCLDSGCTTHLPPHLDWMENVMPYESEINLAEEGKVTHATAKGDTKVSTCTENGIENVQIKGVLHVPNLRSNLLSIYELTNKGNTVIFNRDGAKIYNEQDDLIAEAQIQDRMYVMETRSRDEYSEKKENVMTTKDDFSNDNISLWHRRLNHLNEAYMKEIIQRIVVLGFNVKFNNLPECEACIMGKLTRQPYHPVTTNCTTKPLELVHMDLCGPMPYQSLGGSKYFFVLVDDFSRRTFIYFLKNKDETLGKFEEFKARVENELNLKIKDVRTDNGTEFTNHRFKNFLIKNGIHHQLSTTYSPQSNGVAERVNRTLIETARTLLFDSGLPMAFWAEAVATASYVKNCTPHRSIKLDTPMEKWKGRKPSIRHLRIFGCLAFWPITQQHRSKFMPKSRKGIFVGYSLKRKAYRVYDIITKKIEEEEEDDIEIDHRTRPETSELNEETIPTLDEPNEERIVRSGRKKGDTQKVLEEKHRAKLREEEMKLLEQGVRRSQRIKERNNVNFILEPEERIPENYEEAINCENKYEWLEAMKE